MSGPELQGLAQKIHTESLLDNKLSLLAGKLSLFVIENHESHLAKTTKTGGLS